MADDAAATKAIEELNGAELDGRTLVVKKPDHAPDFFTQRIKNDFHSSTGMGSPFHTIYFILL